MLQYKHLTKTTKSSQFSSYVCRHVMEVLALQSDKILLRTREQDPCEGALLKLSQQNLSCFPTLSKFTVGMLLHIFRKTDLHFYSPCL